MGEKASFAGSILVVVASFVEKKEERLRCVRFNDFIKKEKKEEISKPGLCDFLLAIFPACFPCPCARILWALPGNQIRQCLIVCCICDVII